MRSSALAGLVSHVPRENTVPACKLAGSPECTMNGMRSSANCWTTVSLVPSRKMMSTMTRSGLLTVSHSRASLLLASGVTSKSAPLRICSRSRAISGSSSKSSATRMFVFIRASCMSAGNKPVTSELVVKNGIFHPRDRLAPTGRGGIGNRDGFSSFPPWPTKRQPSPYPARAGLTPYSAASATLV